MRRCTRNGFLAGLLAFAQRASAQVASKCPTTDVCFKLNIPERTSSTGNGDIFFQVSAPSTYEWVALGQGTGMSGSNIFVVYTAGNGNVTLSPRLGRGHQMPQLNSNAQVALLEGSGVSNGKMVANVRCSSCNSWSGGSASFSGNNGDWIYAYSSSGGPKDTTSQSAPINEHSEKAPFQWSYTDAKGGSSLNPLVSATTSSGTGNSTSNSSTPPSSSGGRRSPSGRMVAAHAALAALAFLIFFPVGSIAIRLASFTGVVWFHAAFQVLGYLVFVAGFGIGIYLADSLDVLDDKHAVIGIVVFAVLFFQPILGLVHHSLFKKKQARTIWSHGHIWIGRAAITLGIINGGLGFDLADDMNMGSRPGMIAYSVIAGVMWLAWVVASIFGESRRKKRMAPSPPVYKESGSPRGNSGEPGSHGTTDVPHLEQDHYAAAKN